ncbi:class I adenylate-forming enzyme family protein [Noviherbaspirillum saxi]|uniref:Cyclohexanecarboxylate-CoA ligase n=1 Tax=Noviherbaspirillum saxi TaxID=2320863 RepID=A0A3A3FE96_9BURK|nr:AMP-binding protein [Noviherbaspirillum saxi]RJF91676.1 cyclohexanecarboxylate-CoA ligase [Noviherbaspirillum saxi]
MHDHFNGVRSLWDLLLRRVELSPDAPMLVEPDGCVWSFAQAARQVERIAAGLYARGVAPGTQVTWQLPSHAQTVFLSFALARLGAIQNPVIHLYGKKEVLAILKQNRSAFHMVPVCRPGERDYPALAASICAELPSPPQLIAFDDSLASDDVGHLPPPAAADEVPRWIYYTSGTTSDPKGACHTDATLIASGRALAKALNVGPGDVGSITFPYAHVGGSMYAIMLIVSGMSALVLSKFVADEAIALFRRFGVTASGGSTAHYQAFLVEQRKHPQSPIAPTLKLLSGGGAPKPPELYFQAKTEMRCTIAHSYGMTEVPMIAGGSPLHEDEQLAHSDGMPVEDMDIRIVHADGRRAALGESGEIRVKGPTVCKGYANAALNADAFDADGYFRTGDIGMLRPDGHLAITGRLKDVIIRKGENVSAREVEDILFLHPKVAAVAVIGVPDAERGERVCAVVELKDAGAPLAFDEMVGFFEASGAMRQKIPEQLEIVDSLPRNETFNKILKFKLRERFAASVLQSGGETV